MLATGTLLAILSIGSLYITTLWNFIGTGFVAETPRRTAQIGDVALDAALKIKRKWLWRRGFTGCKRGSFLQMPYLETSQDFSSKSIPGVVSSARHKAADFTLGLLQLFGVYVGVYNSGGPKARCKNNVQ